MRDEIRSAPPDILLTNYMMLELLLTRSEDRELVRAAQGLKFLVFDELHTYRGRQGADVAMLIRRCRHAFGNDAVCVGTSATMASGGSSEEQRREVARVSQRFFGVDFTPEQVIAETLERSTPEIDPSEPSMRERIREAVFSEEEPPSGYEAFRDHPLASWIESTFGVREETDTGRLIRRTPRRLEGEQSAAAELAELLGTDPARCARVLRRWLLRGSTLRTESRRFPIFAFRLHQFLTRGDTVWASLEPEGVRHLEIAKKATKPGDLDKPLFPLVFCRHCGTAYYRARVASGEDGETLLPREDRREDGDDGSGDAYLYLSEDAPWPRDGGPALLERLPDSLKETTAEGVERIRPDARGDVPRPVFVDPAGRVVPDGQGVPAALIHRNFLFCLEPSCGVAYTRYQRSDAHQAGDPGCGQSEHGHHDPRGAVAHGVAARPGPRLRGPQAAELYRQPAGRLPAGGSLQRLRAGRPAALGAVQGVHEEFGRAAPRRLVALPPRGHGSRVQSLRGGLRGARSGPAEHDRRPAARAGVLPLPRSGARAGA